MKIPALLTSRSIRPKCLRAASTTLTAVSFLLTSPSTKIEMRLAVQAEKGEQSRKAAKKKMRHGLRIGASLGGRRREQFSRNTLPPIRALGPEADRLITVVVLSKVASLARFDPR